MEQIACHSPFSRGIWGNWDERLSEKREASFVDYRYNWGKKLLTRRMLPTYHSPFEGRLDRHFVDFCHISRRGGLSCESIHVLYGAEDNPEEKAESTESWTSGPPQVVSRKINLICASRLWSMSTRIASSGISRVSNWE